jgi:hypothetical protein
MTIKFVTTCNKDGLDEYGYRLLANRHNLPAELIWYTEGYSIPGQTVDLETLEDLQAFKKRHANYKSPSFTMDVVRFSHKIFACIDAFRAHDDLGVWIDADVIPYKPMPEEYVRAQLPEGFYIAMFKRAGNYSECGYWVVDCKHPAHQTFLNALRRMYVDDAFIDLPEWHDSYLMDVIVRNLENVGVIKSHNLTAKEAEKETHPMAKSDIAQYLDHTKGPERKKAGFSGENVVRMKERRNAI